MSTCRVGKNRFRSHLTTTPPVIPVVCLVFLASISFAQGLPEGDPEALGFSTARLHRVENILAGAVEKKEIAGAVDLIARRGKIAFLQTFGMVDMDDQEPMEVDTIFGLGFAVLENPGLAGNPGSVGAYFWGGFFNTQFFVDPEEELIGIIMTQRFPADRSNLRQKFVNGAYQALVD